jgi:hypothetical protein
MSTGTFSMAELQGAPPATSAVATPTAPTAPETPGTFSMAELQAASNPPTNSQQNTLQSDRTSVGIGSVNTERLHNLGQGIQETGQDVWGAIKGLATATPPGVSELHEGIQEAIPSFHAYENARSQGKGVWESIKAANDEMARQQAARDVLRQRIEEFKKNPQVASVRAIGDAAALAASIYAGKAIGAPEAGTTFDTETGNLVSPKVAEGVTHVYNAATGDVEAVPKQPGIIKQVLQGKKVAQPGAQSAVREAVQTGVNTANDATAAREATQSNVKIPDEYKDLVNEAMNQEPAWTPEKAQPVVKALGNDYEIRGSVGEGKVTNNDLDIYQKTGKLSDASDKLTDLGFKRAYATDHGEVWTNEKTGQNVDLWDAQHEPKPGFGPDQTPESEPAPVANKKSATVSDNAPLVKGNTTILDDHLDTLAQNEKATYKRMDDTAGFDVKALKDKLKTDQYNLKQLGSSDPDKAGRLVEAINDSTDRIAEAEAKMKAAGIDPKEADGLHQQRMAGEDVKKVITRYTNADGSVNVRGMLRGLKQLRFAKYGDRLEQFTGSSEAADTVINKLDAMDKLGTHAVKARWVAGLIGGYVLPKVIGHALGGQVGNVISMLP